MRAIWKGAVSFGLVSVPVKLYAATESHDVSFRQVHAKDGGRIKYQRVCSLDGEEVPYSDIAKGYETEDGEMVILSDDDMAELPATSSREIAVEKFVPSDQIDPMLFEKSYYLEPEKSGAKPYALLRQALKDADRMAVVTVALRQRTSVAVLRVRQTDRGDVIVLQTMMWPDEVRVPDFDVEVGDVKDTEVKMAHMLVETLAGDFDASEFEDDYAGAVEALVKAKIEGGEVKRTEKLHQDLRRGRRPAGRAPEVGGRGEDRPGRGAGRRRLRRRLRRREAGEEDDCQEDDQEGPGEEGRRQEDRQEGSGEEGRRQEGELSAAGELAGRCWRQERGWLTAPAGSTGASPRAAAESGIRRSSSASEEVREPGRHQVEHLGRRPDQPLTVTGRSSRARTMPLGALLGRLSRPTPVVRLGRADHRGADQRDAHVGAGDVVEVTPRGP